MYITNTTDSVRKIIEEIGGKKDCEKMQFLLYVFNCVNNNQINEENELNPDLMCDDMKIFDFSILDLSSNACAMFLQFNVMVYNFAYNNNVMFKDGDFIGLKYDSNIEKIISNFEKLSFNEKLDIISELIIKYDNKTYFSADVETIEISSKADGFKLAKYIMQFKQ